MSGRPWKARRCSIPEEAPLFPNVTRAGKGKAGEAIAAEHLVKNRFRIIERNYRCFLGEIDIIAEEGRTIVFVEVKSKTADTYGRPEEAVDARKQVKLSRVALSWLRDKASLERPARFDVISVSFGPQNAVEIIHYRNAFDLRA